MTCAIVLSAMAHQWRNRSAPSLICAYSPWHGANGAPLAKDQRRKHGAMETDHPMSSGNGLRVVRQHHSKPRAVGDASLPD